MTVTVPENAGSVPAGVGTCLKISVQTAMVQVNVDGVEAQGTNIRLGFSAPWNYKSLNIPAQPCRKRRRSSPAFRFLSGWKDLLY